MENPRMGRTPQFAEVVFGADQPVGQIVQARIAGHDSAQLTAGA